MLSTIIMFTGCGEPGDLVNLPQAPYGSFVYSHAETGNARYVIVSQTEPLDRTFFAHGIPDAVCKVYEGDALIDELIRQKMPYRGDTSHYQTLFRAKIIARRLFPVTLTG